MKTPFGQNLVDYGLASNGLQTVNPENLATPQSSIPAIDEARWVRNGKHPNAALVSIMGQACNQAAMMRPKEIFRKQGGLPGFASASSYICASSANSLGDRTRWRFAFHTGPYTPNIMVVCVMAPATTGGSSAYARIDLTTSGVTKSETFYYGTSPYQLWMDSIHVVRKIVPVTPDADYTAAFVDVDFGILQSACIYELPSLTQVYGGYLQENVGNTAPILAEHRQRLADVSRNLWRRGGAQLVNFTADNVSISGTANGGRPSMNGGAQRSVFFDPAVWSGPPSSPIVLNMTNKDRTSQSAGVPIVMQVYVNNGSTDQTGAVQLVSTTGAGGAVVLAAGPWAANFSGWTSVSGNIPATIGGYDIKMTGGAAGAGNQFDVAAVSIYEYEA